MSEIYILKNGTTWRTAFLFHITSIISSGSLPSEFYEIAVDDDCLDEIFPFIRAVLEDEESEESMKTWEKQELVIDAFLSNPEKVTGFLAKLECPVFQKSKSGHVSYSWGYSASKWVHVNNVDDLIVAGEAFENEVREKAEEQ